METDNCGMLLDPSRVVFRSVRVLLADADDQVRRHITGQLDLDRALLALGLDVCPGWSIVEHQYVCPGLLVLVDLAAIFEQTRVLGYLLFGGHFELDRVLKAINDAPTGLKPDPVEVLLDF